MNALKTRLTLGLSATLVLLLGLQYWVISGAVRATAEDYVAERLRHDTEDLLAGLAPGSEGLRPKTVPAIYRRSFSGHYFRIRAGEQDWRSRSLWDTDLPLPTVSVGETRRLHATGPQEQPLLVRVAAFRKKDRVVRIAVAEDLSALNRDLDTLQWRFGAVSLTVAAALLVLQWAMVALGLRPLARLRAQVGALERGEQDRLSERVPAEVRPLVRELNRLLGVLGERVERSRNALGNLAHALKTPLTRLTQAAEDPAAGMDAQTRSHIAEAAAEIDARIERELKRARLAAGPAGQRFDPGRELPALIRVLEHIHADRELVIGYQGPGPGNAFGDREDLLELAGNLLDNACKWAASEVRIMASVDPGLTLTVEDDGPGVPPAERDQLTRRGNRLDETHAGHGLGLAIVGDIVEAYGGSLRFDRSTQLGGLCVRVRLPPAEGGKG